MYVLNYEKNDGCVSIKTVRNGKLENKNHTNIIYIGVVIKV